MTHKYTGAYPPLCRACGRKISKHTEMIYVYAEPPRTEAPEMKNGEGADRFKQVPTGKMTPIHVAKHVVGSPRTKEEAQRLVNEKIVSLQYNLDNTRVDRITVWDGGTYVDEFFCNRTRCAVSYAYMIVASPNNKIQSVAYADALYLQQNGKSRP